MTSNIVQVHHHGSKISFNSEEIDLLKKSILDNSTTDAELALFSKICQRTGLDPFARQIFGIRRDSKDGAGKLTFQTSVDGYRLIADRTRCYAGSDDPLFDEGLTLYQHLQSGRENPVTATVTVWKIVQGVRCPFVASASWKQYSQTYYDNKAKERKLTSTWAKMPHLMLSKCAESLALRKAFPAELSGIYTAEEFPAEQESFNDFNSSSAPAQIQPVRSLKPTSPRSVEVFPPSFANSALSTPAHTAMDKKLQELRWTLGQFKQCLEINFKGRNELGELSDRELRDLSDFLTAFETTSLEFKRLGWATQQCKDFLIANFDKETRSSLTFSEIAELLKLLQAK